MPDPGPREAAKIVQLAGGEIIGSTRLQKIGCLLELVGAGVGFEPPRVCRRPFGLSYAAMACCSSMA
jgi:hypothetical protein